MSQRGRGGRRPPPTAGRGGMRGAAAASRGRGRPPASRLPPAVPGAQPEAPSAAPARPPPDAVPGTVARPPLAVPSQVPLSRPSATSDTKGSDGYFQRPGEEIESKGMDSDSQDDEMKTEQLELGEDLSTAQLNAPAKDKYRLLPEFLKVRGLVKQHIDSYDYFVNVEMKKIVTAQANREIRSENYSQFFLIYENIYVGRPEIDQDLVTYPTTPQECRLRDLTYAAPIYVDVRYTKGGLQYRKRQLPIGKIPVMLRSSKCVLNGADHQKLAKFRECPYDPGGYFVVKGSEKVILIQEQLSKNRIIIETDAKKQVTASVTSSTHERKSRTAIYIRGHHIYLKHNTFTVDVPVVIALKAMGLDSDRAIVSMISPDADTMPYITTSLGDASRANVVTQEQALEFIGQHIRLPRSGKRNAQTESVAAMIGPGGVTASLAPPTRIDEARDMLANLILTHVPVEAYDFRDKAFYLCYMIRQCCMAQVNPKLLDDKDYYGNKRLELAGQLLALLFEDLFKRFNTELKLQAERVLSKPNQVEAFDIMKHMTQNIITNGFVQAISTGNWSLKRFRMERAGVTQQLSRLSFMSAVGHMTRITSQFEKTRKVSGPRALQPSQWGMLCPSDTPEGESCGLVKNLALLTHVTSDEEEEPIRRLCVLLGVQDIKLLSGEEIYSPGAYVVMLNGQILGLHGAPEHLAEQLRRLRRAGRLGEFVSVFVNSDKKMLQIATDGGRMCRPLIIVDRKRMCGSLTERHLLNLKRGDMSFHDLLSLGLIEYIDVNESNNTKIALDEEGIRAADATHLEIDPLTILGIVVGLVPYPHHNQSPRNTYQCAMGKQAIGTIAMNQWNRFETLLYLMIYPMKPLVQSRTLELVNFDAVPAGQNAIVAVCSYSGYDIEDAIILNKSSLDRGFARAIVLRKWATALRTYPNNTYDQLRAVPPRPEEEYRLVDAPSVQDMRDKLRALDVDGIAKVGATVYNGNVLVNRFSPKNTNDLMEGPVIANVNPAPLVYKGPDDVVVDKVVLTSSEYEQCIIKVLTRHVRRPELGDKFASRHGQKGVCGLIVNHEDMPFNEQGVVPDICFNPHGIPSRMTVGLLNEFISGKAAVMDGRRRWGTAFAGDSVVDAGKVLVQHGFCYTGKDILTSGISGETIQAHIYMGPAYYQRLKHMVLDKMHARARGPRAVLTRQPTEGRSRDGGLRLGEMERDCLIGYGASGLLVERLMVSSDRFHATVCLKCGMICRPQWCPFCRSDANLTELQIPYACKLLFQELESMNILPKLKLEDF